MRDQAPRQEPREATGAKGARAGDFLGGSLGAQVPSLARGVPTPSLDPRRAPASRDKRPCASRGLGHMGPGCEQLAYLAANPQTPQSSHHHCEEQEGGPQEMAVVGAGAGSFRARTLGGACAPRSPHHNSPSRQCAPPLRYQARFTVSLGSCPLAVVVVVVFPFFLPVCVRLAQ